MYFLKFSAVIVVSMYEQFVVCKLLIASVLTCGSLLCYNFVKSYFICIRFSQF